MNRNFNLLVTINAAMTLDGKIATTSGYSKISSEQDLKRVHKLRSSVDAIIIGISTVLIDNPRLSVRVVKGNRKNPARIIVDSTARIPLTSKILQTASKIKTIVAVTKRAPYDKIRKIEKTGALVIIAGTEIVDLKEVFLFLKKIGFKKILGGRLATTLVEGEGYAKVSEAIKMKLTNVMKQNNGEIVLYYKICSNSD